MTPVPPPEACNHEEYEVVPPPQGLEFASELVLLRCKGCGKVLPQ